MISKADLIICVVETSIAGDKLSVPIALETGAGNNVEHAISAIAVFCGITAPSHLEIINIFWIKLRPNVGSNTRVWNRYAIKQPAHLMPAANMEQIMHHVCAGDVIRNHRKTIGLVGAGRRGDLLPADYTLRGGRLRIDRRRSVSDFDGLSGLCDRQREMQTGVAARSHRKLLRLSRKAGEFNCNPIISQRHTVEAKLACVVGNGGFIPIRSCRAQSDLRALDGPVLRIVNESAD